MTFDLEHIFYFCVAAFLIYFFYLILIKSKNQANADPIAKAEVYMMYGRKDQAIKILEKALKKEPSSFVIENKLKEILNSELK